MSHEPTGSLKIVDFRCLLAARVLVSLAIQIQGSVVGWQVYELTKNPLSLGLLGLAEVLPSVAVALYAGHVTDVVERRRIAMGATLTLFIALALLGVASGSHLGKDTLLVCIYGLVAITGLGRGFYGPSVFALLSQIVPRNLLGNASAWNSTMWQMAAMLGPVIGGFLYVQLGPSATYGFSSLLLLVSVVLFQVIRSRTDLSASPIGSVTESIKEGLKFVFSNQIILGAMSVDLFGVLFGGAVALLPIFVDEVFHRGPEALGVMRAAPAIGAFLTALLITRHPIKHRAGMVFLCSVAAFGVCMIAFGLSRDYYLSLALLSISGIFDGVSIYVRATIYQLHTPDEMKGRVAAVNSIFISSSNEIGEFESGVAAKLMGTARSVIFGGFATLAVVIITALKAPQLRRLDLE
jgi:MFS family permease